MHTVWRALLDDEFVEAYKNGIVVKCFNGIVRRMYPQIFTYSADYPVTVHLLYHGIFLFSFLRRTPLLFGMYSYDWIHTLILLSSLNSSFIEL